MPQIPLPAPIAIDMTLSDALLKRNSYRTVSPGTLISLSSISTMLGWSIGLRADGKRPYPSGGGKYSIETYLIAQGVDSLPMGVFHYSPERHVLEHLWDTPAETKLCEGSPHDAWAEHSSALIVFTALWERSFPKYGDFSYALSLLEAGHMAENTLLAATALRIGACSMSGYNDANVSALLDIDNDTEQPIHTIALNAE
jgi:SagB-type dehydrogenase family enzyme